jgi:hypothetical protein
VAFSYAWRRPIAQKWSNSPFSGKKSIQSGPETANSSEYRTFFALKWSNGAHGDKHQLTAESAIPTEVQL